MFLDTGLGGLADDLRASAAKLRTQAQGLPQGPSRSGLISQAQNLEAQAQARSAASSQVPVAVPGAQSAAQSAASGIASGVSAGVVGGIVQGLVGTIANVGVGVYTSIEQQRMARKQFAEDQRRARVYEQQAEREQALKAELERERLERFGGINAQTTYLAVGGAALLATMGLAAFLLWPRGGAN